MDLAVWRRRGHASRPCCRHRPGGAFGCRNGTRGRQRVQGRGNRCAQEEWPDRGGRESPHHQTAHPVALPGERGQTHHRRVRSRGARGALPVACRGNLRQPREGAALAAPPPRLARPPSAGGPDPHRRRSPRGRESAGANRLGSGGLMLLWRLSGAEHAGRETDPGRRWLERPDQPSTPGRRAHHGFQIREVRVRPATAGVVSMTS